jgi:hypothetical protein
MVIARVVAEQRSLSSVAGDAPQVSVKKRDPFSSSATAAI